MKKFKTVPNPAGERGCGRCRALDLVVAEKDSAIQVLRRQLEEKQKDLVREREEGCLPHIEEIKALREEVERQKEILIQAGLGNDGNYKLLIDELQSLRAENERLNKRNEIETEKWKEVVDIYKSALHSQNSMLLVEKESLCFVIKQLGEALNKINFHIEESEGPDTLAIVLLYAKEALANPVVKEMMENK